MNLFKKKLFDFSVWSAAIAIAAYTLMLILLGYTFFASGYKAVYAVIFVLLVISFLFVFVYFVILSPHLEDDGIHQGAKFIPRCDITCRTAYDFRFKEGVILLKYRSIDYKELDKTAKKKKTIRVQATKANLRKVGEYLGYTLEAPKKPSLKKAKKMKQEPLKNEKDKGE